MGVSLQMYRVRIGTFHPSVRVKTTMEQPRTDKNKNLFKWSYKLMTCFALLCLLTTFFLLRQDHLKLWTNLVQAAPTTACDPSRGPICTPGLSWTLSTAIPWTCQSSFPPGSPRSTYHTKGNNGHNPFKLFQVQPHSPWTSSACVPASTRSQKGLHLNPTYLHIRQPPSWLSARTRNSLVKAENGNRGQRGKGIKIVAWNKGNSLLQNKHSEIQTIIASHHPHILGLSEANYMMNTDPRTVQHDDYILHTAPTLDNPVLGVSRVVVYTHSSIIVKRRPDLEDSSLSAIWLEVGMPRQKKILVCNIYREWQYMGQGPGNQSGNLTAQSGRWSMFLDKWEAALRENREVIVLGDINLDFLKWGRDLPANDSQARLRGLAESLFTRIIPLGVSQLVRTATRAAPNTQASGLDHIYTNKPDKCSDAYTEFIGGSDHKLIQVTRYCKSLKNNVRYVRKRVFKNFCALTFCEAVRQLSWYDLYMCDSPSQAAEILTSKISEILDQMAPIRTIQVRKKYVPWLSSGTKELMKKRDEAQAKAAQSKSNDDWRSFKNLRNVITSRVRAEKRAWEQNKLDGSHQDPGATWSTVKSWLSWGSTGPPTKLFVNGEMVTSPSRLAGAMNDFFLTKVRQLREKIPTSNMDPLAKLRQSMQSRNCTFTLRPVRPEQAGLRNSKSSGPDHWVIKMCQEKMLLADKLRINR